MRNTAKRLTTAIAAVAAITLSVTACAGGSEGGEANGGGDTVKIGVVLPFTGVQAAIAELEGEGASVAADMINDAGGVAGKWKIELVEADDQLDTGRSATVIRDLNDQGVALAVGGQTSDLCKSSAEAAQRFNMTFIGAHCTSPDLVDPPITENFFMIGQQMTTLATAIGANLADAYPDVETWDVVTYDVEAMRSSWDIAKSAMEEKLGHTVEVGEQYAVSVGGTTLRNEIAGLAATPDKQKRGLFLGVYGAGTTAFLQQAAPTGILDEYAVVAQTGVYWPTAVSMEGTAQPIVNVHDYFYPCQDTPENDEFVAAFEEATGEKPDTGAYQGYLAVRLLAAAIEKADSTDTAKVQEALEGLTIDTPQGLEMTIDAESHAGNGAATVALLAGDPDAPQGVGISDCSLVPAS
jgi:branched-chain amino acid transport system substrate-binding protein